MALLKLYIPQNLSKKIIRQNLFWAIGYNVIAIPLAAIGMSLSSLLAVLNVLLL